MCRNSIVCYKRSLDIESPRPGTATKRISRHVSPTSKAMHSTPSDKAHMQIFSLRAPPRPPFELLPITNSCRMATPKKPLAFENHTYPPQRSRLLTAASHSHISLPDVHKLPYLLATDNATTWVSSNNVVIRPSILPTRTRSIAASTSRGTDTSGLLAHGRHGFVSVYALKRNIMNLAIYVRSRPLDCIQEVALCEASARCWLNLPTRPDGGGISSGVVTSGCCESR